MDTNDILYADKGKPAREPATIEISCTACAIKGRLRRGFVVECKTKGWFWRRVGAVRFNDGPHFRGLWVQEHGGLAAWFSPDQARCRVVQEGEKP